MPMPKRQCFDYSKFNGHKGELVATPCVRNVSEKELVEEFLQSDSCCISTVHVSPDKYIDLILRDEVVG